MSIKHSYTVLSPIYDLIVAAPTQELRCKSIQRLLAYKQQVLLNGIGNCLIIPHLPLGLQYTSTDLTPTKLSRAHQCAEASADTIQFEKQAQ